LRRLFKGSAFDRAVRSPGAKPVPSLGVDMKTPRALYLGIVAVGAAMLVAGSLGTLHARQNAAAGIKIGSADIGGVVTSAHGPEAGVWVIATTADLPTKYAKIVVTDD